MNNDLIEKLQSIIQASIIAYNKNKTISIFDQIIGACQTHYEGAAHNLTEIRLKQNTKIKGDVFEHFALLFFSHAYKIKFSKVWLLADVPKEILTSLGLKKRDQGIDIICRKSGKYYAAQVKYRKKGKKVRHSVTWKQLSTFYGLVSKTGPFQKHFVFTNCDWVGHIGRGKGDKDVSIVYNTFKKITIDQWLAMAGIEGHILEEEKEIVPLSLETLREKRLKYFDKQNDPDI